MIAVLIAAGLIELAVIIGLLVSADRDRVAFIRALRGLDEAQRQERSELLERIQRPDRPPHVRRVSPAERADRERAMAQEAERQRSLAQIGTIRHGGGRDDAA